jgi:hypothetical protein
VSDGALDRITLRRAFEALSVELARERVIADVYVFGGAAIVLGFDGREATRDVDATWAPYDAVRPAVERVARRLGLPTWWLNDQATSYLSSEEDAGRASVFETANLRISTASPEHMLAMKALAARPGRDFDDLLLLCSRLGIASVTGIEAICERFFPSRPLGDRQRLMAEDVVAELIRGAR